LLARRLTTLDVLSSGRLRVGLGIGWSPDEYDAAGVPWKERGRRADESLGALKAIWITNPVELQGAGFKVPPSYFDLKPVQKPHPPIYMAAFAPAAMQRAAREADGWFPVGVSLSAVGPKYASIQTMVREAGRNPESFELIVRGNLELTKSPISNDRRNFCGTLEQIAEDVESTRKLGAAELVLDVVFSPGIQTKEDVLGKMEEIKRIFK